MSATRTSAFAQHVETAKRLLGELEQHADSARQALQQDRGAEFLAAIEERERLLHGLSEVVTELAHDHAAAADGAIQDVETSRLLAEMAHAAARALESHRQLESDTQRERDRLGSAIQKGSRSDSVASQYAAASNTPRPQMLSVTG